MRVNSIILPLLMACSVSASAQSSSLMVYPAQGQSAEKTSFDKADCGQWATGQTGFDPVTSAPPRPASAPRQRGGVLRGAVTGAVVGEIVNDDAGKGAATGAVIGGIRQSNRNQRSRGNADAQNDQQMRAYEDAQNQYQRAVAVCLESRGYSVR